MISNVITDDNAVFRKRLLVKLTHRATHNTNSGGEIIPIK
jgi:hypothetical protein